MTALFDSASIVESQRSRRGHVLLPARRHFLVVDEERDGLGHEARRAVDGGRGNSQVNLDVVLASDTPRAKQTDSVVGWQRDSALVDFGVVDYGQARLVLFELISQELELLEHLWVINFVVAGRDGLSELLLVFVVTTEQLAGIITEVRIVWRFYAILLLSDLLYIWLMIIMHARLTSIYFQVRKSIMIIDGRAVVGRKIDSFRVVILIGVTWVIVVLLVLLKRRVLVVIILFAAFVAQMVVSGALEVLIRHLMTLIVCSITKYAAILISYCCVIATE